MHPLDPLDGEEIAATVAAVDAERRYRFVTVTLLEPEKTALAAWREGDAVERLAEVVALDPGTEGAYDGVVDVRTGEILRW